VEATRHVDSKLSPANYTLENLSTLLHMTNGVTKVKRYPKLTYYLRAAPSAGALYPTVTYVLVKKVLGLDPGLYHYSVKDHSLHHIRSNAGLHMDLAGLTDQSSFVEKAPVTLIFSTIFFRSNWKYSERSYRYCLLDAGHLAVQATLTAGAQGYATRLLGRFDDAGVNAFLGVDEKEESALLIVPVLAPVDASKPAESELSFQVQPKSFQTIRNPLMMLIHGGTNFSLANGRTQRFPIRAPEDKPYIDSRSIPLPDGRPEGQDLFKTITARRSVRNFAREGITLPRFTSLLNYSYGISKKEFKRFSDPSIMGNNALNLYVVINNVQDMPSGVYYYRRHDNALSQIRDGDYRTESTQATLMQEMAGQSGVVFIMTIDLERMGYPDTDRGYRYAVMDAGMLGGRIYLQSVGLGLGCCGIGAFFDDEINDLIQVSPLKELVIYMAVAGVREDGSQ